MVEDSNVVGLAGPKSYSPDILRVGISSGAVIHKSKIDEEVAYRVTKGGVSNLISKEKYMESAGYYDAFEYHVEKVFELIHAEKFQKYVLDGWVHDIPNPKFQQQLRDRDSVQEGEVVTIKMGGRRFNMKALKVKTLEVIWQQVGTV